MARSVRIYKPSVELAVIRFHPRVQVSIVKAGGQPSVAAIVEITQQSRDLAIRRFHPPVQVVILKTAPAAAPVNAPIGALLLVLRQSRDVATQRFRPRVQVSIIKAGGRPAVARLIQISRQAIEAGLRAFHPIFQPTIKRAGGLPAKGVIVAILRQAAQAALLRFHPIFQPTIKKAGGLPAKGGIVAILRQAGQAALRAIHPIFQPIIKRLVIFPPPPAPQAPSIQVVNGLFLFTLKGIQSAWGIARAASNSSVNLLWQICIYHPGYTVPATDTLLPNGMMPVVNFLYVNNLGGGAITIKAGIGGTVMATLGPGVSMFINWKGQPLPAAVGNGVAQLEYNLYPP